MALAAASMAAAPTLYEYYTGNGISSGLSDNQPYFTLNDKNITIYSGAFHYFRVPRAYWRDRLRKMRAAGLNTVETYVPWNLHEPQSGAYDFGNGGSDMEDFLHLEEFLKTAQEEDLLALVRSGPYICSEWEFGGLPSWILRNTSSVRNSKDPNYLSIVKRYFNVLLTLLAALQFQKGGPIIGFQIENEYGNTGNNDVEYLEALKQMFLDNGIIELLYTSDPPSANGRGAIPGVLQTANFNGNAKGNLDKLNTLQTGKPTMVMEYWTGWYDRWGENHNTVAPSTYKERLEDILDYPASVNQYMFVGSTNFGFLNGANSDTGGNVNSGLKPIVTSYDYDSPLTEYGAYTEKYNITKELIAARNQIITQLPDPPEETPLVAYPELKPTGQLLLSTILNEVETILSQSVIPMESLPINDNSGQSFGYILYRKSGLTLPAGSILKIMDYVRDTVLVLVNGKLVSPAPTNNNDLEGFGFWQARDSTLVLNEDDLEDATVDLVVENFARNNYGSIEQFRQFKGLTADVYIGDLLISDWEIAPLEFKKAWNNELLQKEWNSEITDTQATPALYRFTLNIDGDPQDSFIDLRDWNKGITIVNNFVLGRHFFLGPQQTLYLPAPFLKSGANDIIVFEHYNAPDSLKFSDQPINGGPSH